MPDLPVPSALLPLILLAPVLLAVGYFDLRYMRIPNALSLIALAIFALCAALAPPDDLMFRLGAAAAVLALGFIAFALGLVGGGDVKILACLVLFVPFAGLAQFAQNFALALSLGITVLLALRRVPALQRSSWRGFSERRGFPMGISIALAGLAYPVLAVTAA